MKILRYTFICIFILKNIYANAIVPNIRFERSDTNSTYKPNADIENENPFYREVKEYLSREIETNKQAGFADKEFALGNTAAKTERNFPKAVIHYKRASEVGHFVAQYALASIYSVGKKGVHQNIKLSLHWYEEAAKSKYPPALIALGIMAKDPANIKKFPLLAKYQKYNFDPHCQQSLAKVN